MKSSNINKFDAGIEFRVPISVDEVQEHTLLWNNLYILYLNDAREPEKMHDTEQQGFSDLYRLKKILDLFN